MFSLSMPELLVILGVAIIVVGPSKLPDLAKSLAKGLNEFKKATEDVKSSITENESFKDLKDLKDQVKGTVESLKPGSLLDPVATTPEVTPVMEVKKFEAPASPEAEVNELTVLEPKKPVEDMQGRMAVLDSIVSEHGQQAPGGAGPAPAAGEDKPQAQPTLPDPPKTNA